MATEVEAPQSTRRLDVLARPKQLPPTYREDRRSVYWLDKPPLMPGSDGTTKFACTDWVAALSNHKPIYSRYVSDRPSPKSVVSKAAQNAEASERVAFLAEPKDWARHFTLHRPVMTHVTKGAQQATASERIEFLAKPKTYQPLKIKESWDYDINEWDNEISSAAKNARCSERLETLAEPKALHNHFRFAKPIRWNTEDSTLKAIATLRLQQLARPKSRGKNEQYDPYKVSSAAIHARSTPRIDELCAPIPRKMRQKKP
ncbi:testicular haploid expressed gene protein-like [Lytechinus variegatus]|uniref:testicular haploid expressed gene protein-like n=1 Tax=Lytechinus variegatus TaxID=7654 RepID=UPI001BB27A0E|nr:testicular haploid expressed gene protein-like [Lytechinus variegatus]